MVSIPCSGMPSVGGAFGPSHSSVQALRNCLAGFPVREQDRTVSEDVARSILAFTAGWVSAPTVVNNTERILSLA